MEFGTNVMYVVLFAVTTLTVLTEFGNAEDDGPSNQEAILDSNGICKKNGYFNHPDGCNTCHCWNAGSHPGCTLKGCISTIPKIKREAPSGKINPGGRCKPGEKWKLDDCNECICTHTGYASCSLNDCTTKKRGKRAAPSGKISPGGRCKPGDKWKYDECNECVCTHTGYASCSLNECSTKKRGKRTATLGNSGNECRAGHTWKDNCNSCFCSERGIAMCTDMACPTPPSPPKN